MRKCLAHSGQPFKRLPGKIFNPLFGWNFHDSPVDSLRFSGSAHTQHDLEFATQLPAGIPFGLKISHHS